LEEQEEKKRLAEVGIDPDHEAKMELMIDMEDLDVSLNQNKTISEKE